MPSELLSSVRSKNYISCEMPTSMVIVAHYNWQKANSSTFLGSHDSLDHWALGLIIGIVAICWLRGRDITRAGHVDSLLCGLPAHARIHGRKSGKVGGRHSAGARFERTRWASMGVMYGSCGFLTQTRCFSEMYHRPPRARSFFQLS